MKHDSMFPVYLSCKVKTKEWADPELSLKDWKPPCNCRPEPRILDVLDILSQYPNLFPHLRNFKISFFCPLHTIVTHTHPAASICVTPAWHILTSVILIVYKNLTESEQIFTDLYYFTFSEIISRPISSRNQFLQMLTKWSSPLDTSRIYWRVRSETSNSHIYSPGPCLPYHVEILHTTIFGVQWGLEWNFRPGISPFSEWRRSTSR
jgi:hypothetical protein